jgi:hypothetical protein
VNIARLQEVYFLCDFKLDFFLSNINGYIFTGCKSYFTESQVISLVLLICFLCDLKLGSFCSLILMATDSKIYFTNFVQTCKFSRDN